MPGGARFKFQGSTIAVGTGYGTTRTITAITRANPCVVSATTHGFANGDIVLIEGVVGMTELNGGLYVVSAAATGTFALTGVDSTLYSTYTSGGTARAATMSNFCELTGYNRSGGTSPEIAATSLCSTSQEFEVGLPDYGTTQIDFNFAPKTAIQTAIQAAYKSGAATPVRVVLPNTGGTVVQIGYVQQTSETGSVNGLWTGSMTLRNTGDAVVI